jgi:hypothetical protein
LGRWSHSLRCETDANLGQNGQYGRNSGPPANSAQFAQTAQGAERCPETDAADFEDRAAIVEYDGGIPRAWAEGFALLHPDRPPARVPLRRWKAVIDAIGTFLDHWAAKAAALGWEAADIFGADAARPEISWLNAGPLWAGNGARMVEVHPDHIVFETRSGARQTHYRRPQICPRALPWELGER